MKSRLRTFAPALVGLIFLSAGAPRSSAQISKGIRAHLVHSFMIGNTLLPPGEYTFRMVDEPDLSAMTATSEHYKTSVDFLVKEVKDDHVPSHSQLVFRKYGDIEFLSKIFEAGSLIGVELRETSRQEERFVKQGQQAQEHTEEQK